MWSRRRDRPQGSTASGSGGPEGGPPRSARRRPGLTRALLLPVAMAVVVVAALGFYGDFGEVSSTLGMFHWRFLAGMLGLTCINYAVRYARWQVLLRVVGIRDLRWWPSLVIFMASTPMIFTPARAGEWVRSYYMRDLHGAAVARTAPIILSERLCDTLAMLLLATTGLLVFGRNVAFFVTVLVLAVVAVVGLRHQGVKSLVVRSVQRVRVFRWLAPHIEEFHDSSRALFSARGLSLGLGLGLVVWGLECATFLLVLLGLGRGGTLELLVQAAFIFPAATLVGSLSMLPAGLGVTDGSLTGLTQAIVDVSRSQAAVAALLSRAAILGFGVVVGLAAMSLLASRQFGPGKVAFGSEESPTPAPNV